MKTALLSLFGVVTLSFASTAGAADWSWFRGPTFDGLAAETGWSAQKPRELWKLSVGAGASSVVVSQGRLYTMGNVKDADILYCLDAATGRELWRHSSPCPLERRSFEGGTAGTPAVAGERVFTLGQKGDLFAIEAASGKVLWSKNLVKDFKGARPQWGYAGSPLVEGNHLIVDCGGDGSSTIALDGRTGELAWKSGDDRAGYSSPVTWTWNGQRVLLLFKARALVALAATTGAELWRFPWKTSFDVNAASPIAVGDKVLLSSGYGSGAALLQGQPREPVVVWQNKNLCNQMNSSVLVGGQLYGISGNAGPAATLNCVDWASGALKWSQKGIGCGALTAADNKLIVLTEKGELVIAAAAPAGYQELSRTPVLTERCWVAPVISGGRIYCRSNAGTLVCLDVQAVGR